MRSNEEEEINMKNWRRRKWRIDVAKKILKWKWKIVMKMKMWRKSKKKCKRRKMKIMKNNVWKIKYYYEK